MAPALQLVNDDCPHCAVLGFAVICYHYCMWRSVPAAGALKARRRDSRTLEDAGTAAASLIDQASVVDFLVDDAGLVERPAEDPAVVHRRCELAEGKI